MTDNKKRTDWEPIERDYRAGVLSNREIAALHEVSEGAVRKKAKACNWQRDLSARVQEKARAELIRNEPQTRNPQTEREIVDVAASTVVTVVRDHRRRIKQGNALIDLLTEQLKEAIECRPEIEDAIAEETKDDEKSDRYNRMMKAISIPTHVGAVLGLSNSMKNLVTLERQAFNIDGVPDVVDPVTELLDLVARKGRRLPIAE